MTHKEYKEHFIFALFLAFLILLFLTYMFFDAECQQFQYDGSGRMEFCSTIDHITGRDKLTEKLFDK